MSVWLLLARKIKSFLVEVSPLSSILQRIMPQISEYPASKVMNVRNIARMKLIPYGNVMSAVIKRRIIRIAARAKYLFFSYVT